MVYGTMAMSVNPMRDSEFSRNLIPRVDRVASVSSLWKVGGKTALLNSISRSAIPGSRVTTHP